MANVKKDMKKSNKADNKVDSKKKMAAKKVSKVSKTRSKNPPFSDMVTSALTELKNRQGCTLAAIRNWVKTTYDLEMNKNHQTFIKKFISSEYEQGRIKMVGDQDGKSIDFTKRFNLVAGTKE